MLKKTALLLVLIYSGPFQVSGQQVDSTQAHPLKTDTARKERIVEMEPVTVHSYRSPITQHIDGITFNVDLCQPCRYQNQNIRLTFSYKTGKQDIRSPVIGITE